MVNRVQLWRDIEEVFGNPVLARVLTSCFIPASATRNFQPPQMLSFIYIWHSRREPTNCGRESLSWPPKVSATWRRYWPLRMITGH